MLKTMSYTFHRILTWRPPEPPTDVACEGSWHPPPPNPPKTPSLPAAIPPTLRKLSKPIMIPDTRTVSNVNTSHCVSCRRVSKYSDKNAEALKHYHQTHHLPKKPLPSSKCFVEPVVPIILAPFPPAFEVGWFCTIRRNTHKSVAITWKGGSMGSEILFFSNVLEQLVRSIT